MLYQITIVMASNCSSFFLIPTLHFLPDTVKKASAKQPMLFLTYSNFILPELVPV